MIGQQQSQRKAKDLFYNAATFLFLLAIAVLMQNELASMSHANQEHAQYLQQLRQNLITLESQIKSKNNKARQYQSELVNAIVVEQKRIDKTAKSLERKIFALKSAVSEEVALNEMTVHDRLVRLQQASKENRLMIDLIQNHLKQGIKKERISKFEELAKKNEYFQMPMRKNYWLMERANIHTDYMSEQELKTIEHLYKQEEGRLEQTYHLSRFTQQLPFCIIVPSYKNAKYFRYQFNIQSILNQDYQNYHVVIIDDASDDNTGLLIRRLLKKHNISDSKIKVIINTKRVTAVPNIHHAITKHCKHNQIGFFVDGDDELISRKAFKIFNAVYQAKKPAVAYSISLEYWMLDDFVKDGWSKAYTDEEKQGNMYRDVPQKISHLRSFRIDLYLKINPEDLKDDKGQWFTSTYDEVICLPMLEMSCGNIEFINEYLYLYTYGTGYNDRFVDSNLQWNIAQEVKFHRPKYSCDPQFKAENIAVREQGTAIIKA